MKLIYLSVIVLFIGAFYSCSKSNQLTTTSINNPGPLEIQLQHCYQQGAGSGAISLCLDSVIEDSRCPKGATCFWQGVALAKFTFTANNQSSSFILATNNALPAYTTDIIVQGYKIYFINLYPYPGDTPSAIKAEVEITQQ